MITQIEGAHTTLLRWQLSSVLQVKLNNDFISLTRKGGSHPCRVQKCQSLNLRLSSKIRGFLGGEDSPKQQQNLFQGSSMERRI